MYILSVDPSIDPNKFGFAAFRSPSPTGGGAGVGSLPTGAGVGLQYGTCKTYETGTIGVFERLGQIYNFSHEIPAPDYIVIDYPSMSNYSRSSRGHKQLNGAALALNHQAIGAFLAGINLPEEKILKWNSAVHPVNKKLVKLSMISKYGLPPKTSDHITDAIYRGEWLADMLQRFDFKQLQINEGI
ncbi:MAG: hypothetical protein RDU76_06140 [Candidatus Edwardsbacteria bacterium]|nr:hypothetical protein [Candidatus Edwardsbacteria bacterium]